MKVFFFVNVLFCGCLLLSFVLGDGLAVGLVWEMGLRN